MDSEGKACIQADLHLTDAQNTHMCKKVEETKLFMQSLFTSAFEGFLRRSNFEI